MPASRVRIWKATSYLRVGAIAVFVMALVLPAPTRAGTALDLTPTSGPRGTTVEAEANGFGAGAVTFWWDNAILLGTDPSGRVRRITFSVPSSAPLGPHSVRACGGSFCPDGTRDPHADATFTVTTRPAPTPTTAPTKKATPGPTRRPGPSATPAATHVPPTAGPSPSASVGAGLPVPSFPLAGPSPSPTPLTLAIVTPGPQPPGGVVAPESGFANLVVKDMEITQGIQNLANDMPLVATRRTYARVYIDVFGADVWPHTWGALEARRNGQQIGWIWPENGPITAKQGGGDRTSLDDSLLFRLPAAWLSGEVELTTFVYSYAIETPFTLEPEGDDNFGSREVTFHDALPLTVHLAPLHLHRSYHSSDVERIYEVAQGGGFLNPGTNVGGTNRIISGLFRYLPLPAVNVDSFNAAVTPPGHLSGHEFDLGGACRSVFLDSGAGSVDISDWTTLVKEPLTITPDSNTLWMPDRPDLRIMDRKYTINAFVAHANGAATAYGSSNAQGPDPVPGAPAYAYPCVVITPELHEPNHVLALHRVFYDWADEREMFVGLVDSSLPTSFGGIATGDTDSIWMKMNDFFTATPWEHSGAYVLGHEAGHRGGLGHVPCMDDDGDGVADEIAGGDLDPTHPMTLSFPDCWLSEVDDRGYYGLDVYWDRYALPGATVLSNDPAADPPNGARPLLSYANPGWLDPYHYCKLLNYFGVPCSPTALDLPWNPPNPQPDGSDPFAAFTPPPNPLEPGVDAALIQYTGLEDGTWTLEMVARNSRPTAHQVEQISALRRALVRPAQPSVVVLDNEGFVYLQAGLLGDVEAHGAEAGLDIGQLVVPLPPGASAIEIRGAGGQVLARIGPSAGFPDVAGLFKDTADGETIEPGDEINVRVEASDPDGDLLRYILLYAPDGEHWQVVGVTDEPGIRVPVSDLPSGDDPSFRVVAFDGWAIDELVIPAPELAGPRNPPALWIFTSELPRFPLNARVRLEASAFDAEDRTLPGDSIRWRSSIDGDLGSGVELETRALSTGRHVITATGTDSDGLEGTASIEIVVDGSVVQPVPGADTEAAVERILAAVHEGQDPAAALGDPLTSFLFQLKIDSAFIVVGALLLGVAAFVVLRLTWTPRPSGGHRAAHVVQQGSGAGAEPGGLPPELPVMASLTEGGATAAPQQPPPKPTKQPKPRLQGLVPGSEKPVPVDAPPGPEADDGSTWVQTEQLAVGGSMEPGGGYNELSMDDTSGKERAPSADADDLAAEPGDKDALGDKDVQLKGRNILEN